MTGHKIWQHIIFSGCVQGVGFRYRSYYIAQSLALTGWVKNNWDGCVEMEIQGSREAIEQMLIRLGQQNYIEIERMDIREIPLETEGSFHIR